MRILLVGGAGDSGSRLAKRLVSQGHTVVVTTRQPPGSVRERLPPEVEIWQLDPIASAEPLRTKLLASPPFHCVVNLLASFLRDPVAVLRDGTRNLVSALLSRESPPRLVFCSSTAVYGHRPGEILTEDSPTSDLLRVGRLLLEAEDVLRSASGLRSVILRLPHIYGLGRERLFDQMRRGEMFVFGTGRNRMHHLYIEDFVTILSRSLEPDISDTVYNAVEDVAEPYGDYMDFIAQWCGQPLPARYEWADLLTNQAATRCLGPHLANPELLGELYRYMTSEAILSNSRLKQVFGISFRYPRFRDGLTEMLTMIGEPDRRMSESIHTASQWNG
ncbi:NAD-dependent epimerase/dehydratase family protein [Tuwongella immobilis]|uniref:NAD-dependent epimerase/dehydratase domain-containing protein n=1 Tax=Tuwongella immobilis TaxID=692036 RepID=A0A6C2YQ33_9BACT|nr:NAD-dependent epimerase/dehydratase family protein [Tuwongella immobilis]VIP03504.1 nad-dependent epimerase dehydratase : NAD-dependent epimerase/dehydratase OS=Pedosphaera parvula (strain Ellin514) GN=Cflav_PD4028 PE=4 SV=1: Epimerase [Tuwongella immobilis]VTS04376.1 nad-dependent epimerase dehydratase : NAD-dependent epimerase/dehydratase OS=Pedosphaera parvula (strain Ellin514) GN=Cflav_PD4028 PE=4 SV=1: Epimerase [Tuwongella immobilis]